MSLTYIQFKKLDDFIRFVTLSPSPFIQYVNLNGHNVYFIQLVGFGERVLYYVELDKEIEGKYIVYNRFRDIVSFSSKIESDGQSVSVPILEVVKTNVFTEYPPK
ncbi:MAG: hypothetical protein V1850_05075 [Candidatus Bathyarchaeota archaeon]